MFCGTLKASLIDKLNNRNVETEAADDIESPGSAKMEKSRRHVRRHLPVASGPYTVGIVDIMCERGENGSFFRLYYPTAKTDIYVSFTPLSLTLHTSLGHFFSVLTSTPLSLSLLFQWRCACSLSLSLSLSLSQSLKMINIQR